MIHMCPYENKDTNQLHNIKLTLLGQVFLVGESEG